MTLRESQAFITRMMRDAAFRALVQGPEFDALADEFALDPSDRQQIRAIDMAEFGKFAEYSRFQRVKRRQAEYGLFLNHLMRFWDRERFFHDYHQTETGGQGERLEELRRFDNFALDYILEHGLPEYLVDLVRFCSIACELGETPKVDPGEATTAVATEEIRGNYVISLPQPSRVLTFRHDVLRIADEEDVYGLDPRRAGPSCCCNATGASTSAPSPWRCATTRCSPA
ncbi:hypothetical protein GXW82_08765 [Streptacidiphilus sp. 4-A2]|nr:hypothetical protein [Streptacidiphilus sp. 4-A2]